MSNFHCLVLSNDIAFSEKLKKMAKTDMHQGKKPPKLRGGKRNLIYRAKWSSTCLKTPVTNICWTRSDDSKTFRF